MSLNRSPKNLSSTPYQTFTWKIDQLPPLSGNNAGHEYHVSTLKSPNFKTRVGLNRNLTFRLVLKIRHSEFELLMESLVPYDVDITLALALESNDFRRVKKPFKFKAVGMVDDSSQYESLMLGCFGDLYRQPNVSIPGLRVITNVLSTYVRYKQPNFLAAIHVMDTTNGSLNRDLCEAFENGTGANFSVVCMRGEDVLKTFQVQKNILISRSEVFEAMFRHDCEESCTDTLKITDMSPQALEDFLRFLHTDQVKNINENAEELIHAATKYNLPYLKLVCEQSLCEELDDEKVLKRAVLFDHLGSQRALEFCLEAIADNFADVLENEESWDEIVLRYPNLLKKILKKVSQKMVAISSK